MIAPIVVSGPTINATNLEIVSLAEVKTYTEQTSSSNDALLQVLLDNVHRAFYEHSRRVLQSTGSAWTIITSGGGDSYLELPQWPVDPDTVTIKEGWIADKDLTFTANKTFEDDEWYSDKHSSLYRRNGVWSRGTHNVWVQFEAGYDASSPTEMPPDIKDAFCQWVGVKLLRIQQKRWDKVQVTREAETITFHDKEMPSSARAVFRRYEPLEVGIA